MRYIFGKKGRHKVSANVKSLLDKEHTHGLDSPETYEQFRRNCENSRSDLLNLLKKIKSEGKRVVGYGATSKSTTVNNYCSITSDLVEFVSDTTPIKQGKLTPGSHIPVRSHEEFLKHSPDYALLYAWNHSKEIFDKEQKFKSKGGKWILFVPKVEIIL
jgi:methylation protein EvaC